MLRLARYCLLIVLSIALPSFGLADGYVRVPCPMQAPAGQQAVTATIRDCCNSSDDQQRSGQQCKVGQQCQTASAAQPALASTATWLLAMTVAYPIHPVRFSSHNPEGLWRPPAML